MLPVVFISHGSPLLAIDPGTIGAAWRDMAAALPRPDAILVVSAHWTTPEPTVSHAPRPATLHDFGGFPPALYRLQYPAPGAPALAEEAARRLAAAGLPARSSADRGLDHGAWVPLLHLYPAADIPVTQLSVQPQRDARWHLRVGEALQPLRAQNVLILASGSLTHNLAEFDFTSTGTSPGSDYVRAFQEWAHDTLQRHDTDALADWERRAPAALRAHPTPEHLLPLFVAVGAAGSRPAVARTLDCFSGGALAMDCYVFS